MGYIHAYMTGESVEWNGDDELIEERGYIDPSWSMTVLHESRNDAGTLLSMDIEDPDLDECINDAVVGYSDNGDGTFYSMDTVNDPETGLGWNYAIHFIHKFYGPRGWTEVPYIRSNSGS